MEKLIATEIDLQEIRIGNWFEHGTVWSYRKDGWSYKNDEDKVFYFQWEERDWFALSESTLFIEDVKPIPLTAEILAKAGYSPEPEYKDYMVIQLEGTFNLRVSLQKDCVYVSAGYAGGIVDVHRWMHIRHLHQVQNLYYIWTNKELDIKL